MFRLPGICTIALFLAACGTMQQWAPTSGPTGEQVQGQEAPSGRAGAQIQVVPIDHAVVRRLAAREGFASMPEALERAGVAAPAAGASAGADISTIGPGDVLEISLWEAPPALLFGGAAATEARGGTAGRAVTLPEQMVDAAGLVNVPFVGRIQAGSGTLAQLENLIVRGLTGKANQPQALVRLTRPGHASVTVVGEVASSLRMALTPRGERLLDALAAAGGARQPVNKVSVQLTRGEQVVALPMDALIRDPRQNVALMAGDVVTVLAQPLSFTVLGATGRNEELAFEAQGLTLAQALARAGGLNDSRADVRGVFVFRFEDPTVVPAQTAHGTTAEGRVPVVYALDLGDPASLFVAQGFPIRHHDVLYVSNAPGAELQKFLNLIWGVAMPALSVRSVTR
jgi:polysaccharide export outer membrane protein